MIALKLYKLKSSYLILLAVKVKFHLPQGYLIKKELSNKQNLG